MDCVTDCSPFLVFERGDSTFDQWLAGPRSAFPAKKSALRKVRRSPSLLSENRVMAVQILGALTLAHERGRAIGNLTPNRIVWFPAARAWRLLDVPPADAQRRGRPSSDWPGTKYAAPETVLAELRQEESEAAESASDMWSFGVMLLEAILPGIFRSTRHRAVRTVRLLGESLYRFGASSDGDRRIALSRKISLRLERVPGEHAYTLLRNLLQIDPVKRCTASQALHSAFFRTPDRPRTTGIPQNEVCPEHLMTGLSASLQDRRILGPGVEDAARRMSSEPLVRTVSSSVSVECFRKRSNSSDSFHCRSGKEAYTITDATLPDQSIFLLRAGQNFRLRIRHEYDASSIPSTSRVSAVYARVDEGDYVKLDTEATMGQQRSFEVVALVEPARLQSPRLLIPAPSGEALGEKYVKLDVTMEANVGRVEESRHVIYCKILPRTSRPRYHRFREKCKAAWHVCLPPKRRR